VGTGDGALLEVLAPVFDRVIGVDRSDVQLELADERVRRREFGNARLIRGEIDSPVVRDAVLETAGGASAVFASRVLHHAPVPAKAMRALVELARPAQEGVPGGAVCVIEYEAHDDVSLRENEADLWLGFDPAELARFAEEAGLEDTRIRRLPRAFQGDGPDRHLTWQLLVGRRGEESSNTNKRSSTR
jgi:ArsR family transcriptional regulator